MLNSLGELSLLRHDLGAAATWYHENLATDRGPVNAMHAHLGLARVHLAAGRLDEAAAELDQLEILLKQHGSDGLNDAIVGLRGAVAWRRQAQAHQAGLHEGRRLLEQAIEGLGRREFALDTIPFLYELRDLYQTQGRTAEAVQAMARALDLLSTCGAEPSVDEVENWLRTVHSPSLMRLVLERQFPEFVATEILSGRLRQSEPRRQKVTILFSDVRDYTTLTEGLPPEEIVELLNEWFSEATRAVRKHGGVIDKFIGDAVMAIFGVPESRPDSAADAVRAALEMRDALAALNLRQEALGGRRIQIGIGIDTGEVVAGFIGSHLRWSYTVIGDAVNTASRLESATKDFAGCDILLSERTHEEQQRYRVAETVPLGSKGLKGKSKPVAVYQVKGLRQA
jgi:class 3 adenylate cyclase